MRQDPEIPEQHKNIPPDILADAKMLLEQCFITSTYGGTGYGHTKDEKVAERLQEGWTWQHKDALGSLIPVRLNCPQSILGVCKSSRLPDAPTIHDFTVPPALIQLVRKITDARKRERAA